MKRLAFPAGFLWGAATSAHQTEGDNVGSDWWEWEQTRKVPFASGRAADSWNRWEEDLDLAVRLGLNTYRISVEWARIEPSPGTFDSEALQHYVDVVRGIRERGMKAMVLLWHFTNPVWLGADGRGPWQDDASSKAYAEYVRYVAPALAPYVDFWATFNEVNVYTSHGWLQGDWPPGRKYDLAGAFRTYRYIAQGHRAAYKIIKETAGPDAHVGITHATPWIHAAKWRSMTSAPFQRVLDYLGMGHFLHQLSDRLDWLGVQYYFDTPCSTFRLRYDEDGVPRTDMGSRIMPEGMYHAVMRAWHVCRVPIIVSENGIADEDDSKRAHFICDHLRWLHRAIEDGADVRGYLHWSLIDNFEWAKGFGPRFGLAAVDYETFERRLRPSAEVYAGIVRENAVG